MIDRAFPLLAVLTSACGMLAACGAPPSDACVAIGRDQAIEIADAAKRGMLSRSTEAVEGNFAASAVEHVALNDGRGYGAQVSYRGKDGRMLTALIHEDCYVGWTEGDESPANPSGPGPG